VLSLKVFLILIVWGFALLISIALKLWGLQHPEEFLIRPFLIWSMLFLPSTFLAIWLLFNRQVNQEN
tara:strand:+ start:23 stop:223 length:201 start_codon:yes stop_codon:yes gene_type:complete